jgi:protein TonB
MLRPLAHPALANAREVSGSRRILAFAAAGVIEIGLIFALTSGLATRALHQLPNVLSMVDITPQTPPKVVDVPPPAPEFAKPEAPRVPVPIIRIQRAPAHAITAVATPKPVVVAPAPVAVTPPAAPAVPSTSVQSVTRTHTTPPYPELARRLGQSGQVQLHITIGADGQVGNVSVTKSSGSDLLDSTARDWVMSNWKYKAATQNGSPVASTTDALVVFDLKHSR